MGKECCVTFDAEEARSVLQNDDWSLSLNELDAFISIIYACGEHGATKLKLLELWDRLWGPLFFAETMSRNRLIEIMKFSRFNFKQTRSHQLASDKFALVLSVWHSLDTVCETPNPGLTLQLTSNCFHRGRDAVYAVRA